jgi:hypothetical protein
MKKGGMKVLVGLVRVVLAEKGLYADPIVFNKHSSCKEPTGDYLEDKRSGSRIDIKQKVLHMLNNLTAKLRIRVQMSKGGQLEPLLF